MNGIPAMMPRLVKFAEVVTISVAAAVAVIVMTACAFAIFSGLPICFLL
jgi:low affinity Fe/Cu permease